MMDLTKSCECVGHKLIGSHINQASTETVVRKNQEHFGQNAVDVHQFLILQ